MSWIPAGRGTKKDIEPWLKKDEWEHIALSSRIREFKGNPRFGRMANGRLWVNKSRGRVSEALYISRYGVLLPAFNLSESEEQRLAFLRKFIHSNITNLFSIIGMENQVLQIEDLINQSPRGAVTYKMLVREKPKPLEEKEEEPVGITLHRAVAADLEKLWQLEKAYQIEEVLREGSHLDERSLRLYFQKTLKNQIVYYASLAGRPVAKAGTNARGYHYKQIGGVFVIPELRGCGFGRAVMNRLLSHIEDSGSRACLFVKKSNFPALKLYDNLGFEDMGPFRISYWRE